MLKSEETQKVVWHGFEVAFWAVEEIIGHGIVSQLPNFAFKLFGECWGIFAEGVGDIDKCCVDLVNIQNSVQTWVLDQNLVNILTNHCHGSLDLL